MIPCWLFLVLLTPACPTAKIQSGGIYQQKRVITAVRGDTVTLRCFLTGETRDVFFWYRQFAGKMPQIVAEMRHFSEPTFNKDLSPSRFQIQKAEDHMNLIIKDIEPSDEATYFCGVQVSYEIVFGEAIFLALKGSNQQTTNSISIVQSPVFESVHPGDSVTLQCTVLAESSTEELNLFWFRSASEESHPGTIYTYKNRSKQCEVNSSTRSCLYGLSKNNLSLSDAGTYYCAVTTCGMVLFGNGTMLEISENQQGKGSVI
ncbi:uncharacterized protein LOC115818082 [Chanos chanos]|uniref:Uncharacterized protein LOC115818082 n=1 Tax=Chanos chanos TaxID=29144 RepID=A0A6J2VYU8_CHACN|nr:uncharacterized protein LOC115818082 [Chanos chanos]